ncbi:MAG: phospho-N-acetylmuramoyl-pentapeptide-transferase [bacterium]
MLLTMIIGVPYLDFLKKNFYGQFIREEAPASHTKKAGTPTMGGVVIVISALIGAILALIMDEKIDIDAFIVLAVFSLLALIGFRDDILKINQKQNKGISAKNKLLFQILVALIPALYLTFNGERMISVFDVFSINLGFLYPFLAIFIVIGASNAINLTDGLDGLAAGTSTFAMLAVTVVCMIIGRTDLAIISAAIAGSCVGFLYYNKFPAKVFMGDTGSLALGGALGTLAILGKFELWLLIIGGVFVIETLSVILQVISFKTTGKRIFKMSPIHHHFELLGWTESKIVYTFWGVGAFLAIISCILKYYLYY